jgi:N-acetylglutamate synthase/N-acetylornithine aminotransferase
VTVTCTVGEGPASVQVLSADLSPEYVTLNAYATT